ncbi:putative anti-sigma-YlaC factor YlaD [Rhodopirellula rubra]|uniref:Putative anti-sigma-YlaC factor YlaD n=1 Tax=Aporhodopirellula rubra TaxID=980271 RepID=A0A7W5H6B5_9BACT|nr:putative anti-sigma-YlaC factor YlaD [Aporhodopirellula rubra]
MTLTKAQTANLVSLIRTTEQDDLNCDGCFDQVAIFAENTITGRDVEDAFAAVATHLRQCECCRDEFNALLSGIRELQAATETRDDQRV